MPCRVRGCDPQAIFGRDNAVPNVNRLEWIGKYAAITSALVAATVGIGQYRRGVSQSIRELEWKQADMARTLINGMMNDDGWQAMTMLDWEEGRTYEIAPGTKVRIVPRDVPVAIEAALRVNGPRRTETQRFITDRFDRFLFQVSQLHSAVRSGLVRKDDVSFRSIGTSRSGSARTRSCCSSTSPRTPWSSHGNSSSLSMPGSGVLPDDSRNARRVIHADAVSDAGETEGRRIGCRWPYVRDRHSHSAGPNWKCLSQMVLKAASTAKQASAAARPKTGRIFPRPEGVSGKQQIQCRYLKQVVCQRHAAGRGDGPKSRREGRDVGQEQEPARDVGECQPLIAEETKARGKQPVVEHP